MLFFFLYDILTHIDSWNSYALKKKQIKFAIFINSNLISIRLQFPGTKQWLSKC